jgi:hypothetical protein
VSVGRRCEKRKNGLVRVQPDERREEEGRERSVMVGEVKRL